MRGPGKARGSQPGRLAGKGGGGEEKRHKQAGSEHQGGRGKAKQASLYWGILKQRRLKRRGLSLEHDSRDDGVFNSRQAVPPRRPRARSAKD